MQYVLPPEPAAQGRHVIFVPGIRMPGKTPADARVFRPLARRLAKSDSLVGPNRLHVYAYGPRNGAVLPYQKRDDAVVAYSPRHTFGRVEQMAARLTAALEDFARVTDAPIVLIGYSVGGAVAANAVVGLSAATRRRIAGVVTLAAPLGGFRSDVLARLFQPPVLSYGVDAFDAVSRRLFPDLDQRDRLGAGIEALGIPMLNVAVEGDCVAAPSTALLGWPDAPPFGVEWLTVEPAHAKPVPARSFADLRPTVTAMAKVHGEVVLRRDVVGTIAKYVERVHAESETT